MTLTMTVAIVGASILAYVTVGFVLALIIKRNDIADILWGPGILLSGIVACMLHDAQGGPLSALLALVALWALRLSYRVWKRNHGKPEDPRYKAWREEWGKWFIPRTYGQVFVLQGALMIVMAYPLIHASVYGPLASVPLLIIGALVWLVGFVFESVADWQLDQFLGNKENRGKIIESGLWKYSRHPNYFGEIVMWWGIWIATLSVPMAIAGIVSPLLITLLILKVSGIPMLERGFEGNTLYDEYKKRTSILIPLPQKKV